MDRRLSAMMMPPDTITAILARVKGLREKQTRPVGTPGRKPIAHTPRPVVIVIESTVTDISRRPVTGRLHRRFALLPMAVNVLNHHDGLVDHESRSPAPRQQRQEVEGPIARISEMDTDQPGTPAEEWVATGMMTERNDATRKQEDHHDGTISTRFRRASFSTSSTKRPE